MADETGYPDGDRDDAGNKVDKPYKVPDGTPVE